MIIKLLTVFLMGIFYVCYVSKLLSQKKRGIKTDQLGKGKTGFVKIIEITLKITTYLIIPIQLVSIILDKKTEIIFLQILGAVILTFGVFIFVISVIQMKDNWRAGVQREEKTELVTKGIYSISRNPAFLGFDLMYIGILISFFNWILCCITIFALVLFHLQIVNVEEDFLLEAFGDEYLQYKKKVCRYFGRKCIKYMPEKITLCGDNCNFCPRYNAKTEADLQKVAELWYRVGWRDRVVSSEEIKCTGCSSHKACTYELVECTKKHKVEKCNQCDNFPCEKINVMLARSEEYKFTCKKLCTEEAYKALEKAFFEKPKNLGK